MRRRRASGPRASAPAGGQPGEAVDQALCSAPGREDVPVGGVLVGKDVAAQLVGERQAAPTDAAGSVDHRHPTGPEQDRSTVGALLAPAQREREQADAGDAPGQMHRRLTSVVAEQGPDIGCGLVGFLRRRGELHGGTRIDAQFAQALQELHLPADPLGGSVDLGAGGARLAGVAAGDDRHRRLVEEPLHAHVERLGQPSQLDRADTPSARLDLRQGTALQQRTFSAFRLREADPTALGV